MREGMEGLRECHAEAAHRADRRDERAGLQRVDSQDHGEHLRYTAQTFTPFVFFSLIHVSSFIPTSSSKSLRSASEKRKRMRISKMHCLSGLQTKRENSASRLVTLYCHCVFYIFCNAYKLGTIFKARIFPGVTRAPFLEDLEIRGF